MYIEERGWVKAQILLTNCQYFEKIRLVWLIYVYAMFGFSFDFSNCYLSPYRE